MYVLSNEQRAFGAAYMLDEQVLEQIRQELDCAFYVLPSSVHECMILPDCVGISPAELKALVEEVNRTQVEPEEVLTDSVYHFDSTAEGLILVSP